MAAITLRIGDLLRERESLKRSGASIDDLHRNREAIATAHRLLADALIAEHSNRR